MKLVPETILAQLGGENRCRIMLGGKNFLGGENYLQFDIPGTLTFNKANKVSITLESNDTYTLVAYRYNRRTLECPQVGETMSNIYVENLRQAFTTLTGLTTSL